MSSIVKYLLGKHDVKQGNSNAGNVGSNPTGSSIPALENVPRFKCSRTRPASLRLVAQDTRTLFSIYSSRRARCAGSLLTICGKVRFLVLEKINAELLTKADNLNIDSSSYVPTVPLLNPNVRVRIVRLTRKKDLSSKTNGKSPEFESGEAGSIPVKDLAGFYP